MERREFLKKTGQALALAAITGGTGLLFNNRQKFTYDRLMAKTGDFAVPADSAFPGMALAKNNDHVAALNASLDAMGGIKRFIRPGDRVTIKPNIGWDRTPAQGANTNPVLVAEMVRLCLVAGAAKVIVTDISCNDPRRCFLRSGIKEAAEKAGAKVILPDDDEFVKTDLKGELLTVWPVLKPFVDTDRLINMPIVKQHSLSSCTIGMKNLYGILGGRRNQLHQQIDQSIVDLAAFCRPTLVVVDATRVLTRGGPQGGSLDDVFVADTVFCTTDQVAADSRGAEFLGLTGDKVSHIILAAKSGLGMIDYRAAGYKEII
ncbi:MAG: DUF362 domain-containing protein [candidate division Zixibacteria bacterium]|nr:DUF362 domain-containing protein [candidate division Zixibacteria bacterium]